MPNVVEVCRFIRSKNAGPYWITLDFFFDTLESFDRYAEAEALQPTSIANIFNVPSELVKRQSLRSLQVVKLSYPRPEPQGGVVERDMHGGQQFVRLLDLDV